MNHAVSTRFEAQHDKRNVLQRLTFSWLEPLDVAKDAKMNSLDTCVSLKCSNLWMLLVGRHCFGGLLSLGVGIEVNESNLSFRAGVQNSWFRVQGLAMMGYCKGLAQSLCLLAVTSQQAVSWSCSKPEK